MESTELDFFDYPRQELAEALEAGFGLPSFKATQLFEWVYRRRVQDFSVMTNLAKDHRNRLASALSFKQLAQSQRSISKDGTRKYLLQTAGEGAVESVMIKQPNRMTLCVSSQVGCGMGCTFCRTGEMGFRRNLRTAEIIGQVIAVIDDAVNFGDMFENIVFMGMGEPLHNFKAVTRALAILRDPYGLNISGRKITVSSVGLVPAIAKLGSSGLDVNLAVSLNATTDQVRSMIMPINKAFPLDVLLQCLREYPLKRRKRITIEYVMLSGLNDTKADIERLPKLLNGIRCKLNLIPYNENAGLGFSSPTKETVLRWQDSLLKQNIHTTIRWSKGQDINAACGQLAVSAGKLSNGSRLTQKPRGLEVLEPEVLEPEVLEIAN